MKGLKDKKSGKFVKNIPVEKECFACHNSFSPRHEKQKYCSHVCRATLLRKPLATCEICSGLFKRKGTYNQRYCSSVCYGETLIKPKKQKAVKIYKRVELTCSLCELKFIVPECRKDKASFCSKKCASDSRIGKKLTKTWVRVKSGPENPNWIADRSKLKRYGDDAKDRRSSAYTYWRKSVWLRDNFTCKIANPDCAGRIEAHHILGYTEYSELRYEINNGITLCHAHHPRKRAEEKRLSPYFQSLVSVSKNSI